MEMCIWQRVAALISARC